MINYEYPPIGGGGGVFTYNLSKHLDRLGVNVDILTSHYHGLQRLEKKGKEIKVLRVGMPRRYLTHAMKTELISFLFSSINWILQNKSDYELVHSHFAIPSGISGSILSTKEKIPHLISLLGADVYDPIEYRKYLQIMTPMLRVIYNSANHLVSPSHDMKKRCRSIGCYRPISVIPHGIDVNELTLSSRQPISDDPKIVACVCRLVKRKALQYQIMAIPYVVDVIENTRFIFIGDGPEKDRLKTLVKSLGVSDYVDFTGHVPRNELFSILSSSKIFALHTLYEAFGIVFLEAMALGKPIVSTDVGAIPEIVTEEVGTLVPPMDPKAFATAILSFLTNDEKLKIKSENCKNKVNEFSWQNIVKKYLNIYEKIL